MQTTERKEEVFDEEVQTAESFAEAAYGKEKTDTEKQNAKSEDVTQEVQGEVNPYTGKEYQTNSVRMHPKRIGYVQVYNREKHKWIDMTEWAFLGYEERKKALLGKAYEPPIYLD